MRTICIDAAAEASLTELGYAVIPFLDADAVAEVGEVYWRCGPPPDDPQMCTHFDFQSGSVDYKQAVSDALRPILEPRIDKALDRYHLVSPNYVMKWPGGRSGFAPHQDTNLVDETQHRSVTIWCPLTDTLDGPDGDNGVLRFVPGSHRFVEWIRAHDPGAFAFAGLEQAIIERYGVGVPVRAGEAIVFDHRVAHFSLPNAHSEPRLVIGMGLRPDEADLLHYRRSRDGRFDVYGIDDDYYIKLDPFQLRHGVGGYEKVDEVAMERPIVTPELFETWCADVDVDLARRSAGATSAAPIRTGTRINADPFCFRCGTQTDLVGGNDRPVEHGNLQLLCRSCAAQVGTGASASTIERPPTDAVTTARTERSSVAPTFRDPDLQRSMELDGFVVVDLPTSVIDELEAIYRGTRPPSLTGFTATIQLEDYGYRREVHHRVQEALAGVLAELLDDHRTVAGNYVVKQPGPWQVEPHQDFDFVDESSARAVLGWIPLHDVDDDGSCLQVVPGSHRLATVPRGSGDHRFPFAPALDRLKAERSLAVPLRRGQAVIYDSRTLHGSGPNRMSVERAAAAFAAIPAAAALLHFHVNDDSTVTVVDVDDDIYADTPFHTYPVRGTVRGVQPLPDVPDHGPVACIAALDALDPPPTTAPRPRVGRLRNDVGATLRDPEHERAYLDDGFVVMPFLEPHEVAALTQAYWEMALDDDHGLTIDYARPDRAFMSRIEELLQPVWDRHFDDVFVDHVPVCASFIVKHPGPASNMFLHEDRTWVDERRFRSGTLWIPLADVGPDTDNGGLQIIRHSHLRMAGWSGTGTPDVIAPHHDQLRHGLEWVTAPAGHAVYYDSRTIHASPANRSDAARIVIACGVAPRAAQLIHVLGDGATGRRVFAVDHQFFIRHDLAAIPRALEEDYTLLEDFTEDASLTPGDVTSIVVAARAHMAPGDAVHDAAAEAAPAVEGRPVPAASDVIPLPTLEKLTEDYEHRLDGSRTRALAPVFARVVGWNNRLVRDADPESPNPWIVEEEPWYHLLAAAHGRILEEWTEFDRRYELPHLEDVFSAPQGNVGSWWKGAALIVRGRPVGAGRHFPLTCAALAEVPGLHGAMLSVMGPGGVLEPHTGPNAGALRLLYGVDCGDDAELTVGDRRIALHDGNSVLFDDTEIHASQNRGTGPRVLILCDVVRHFPGAAGVRNRVVQELHHLLIPRFRQASSRSAEWLAALNPVDAERSVGPTP